MHNPNKSSTFAGNFAINNKVTRIMDNNSILKKHISPDALQQIVNLLDDSQKDHCVIHWLVLACKLTITYNYYSNIHSSSECMNMDLPVETIEKTIEVMNLVTHSDMSLSDYVKIKSTQDDDTIEMYKEYQEQLNLFSDKLFIPRAAEKLSEELYDKYKYSLVALLLHTSYNKYAALILDLISGKIDENEFRETFSIIKVGDKALDAKTALTMTKDANKWVSRYLEILKEECQSIK